MDLGLRNSKKFEFGDRRGGSKQIDSHPAITRFSKNETRQALRQNNCKATLNTMQADGVKI